jgi:hypothetical protein
MGRVPRVHDRDFWLRSSRWSRRRNRRVKEGELMQILPCLSIFASHPSLEASTPHSLTHLVPKPWAKPWGSTPASPFLPSQSSGSVPGAFLFALVRLFDSESWHGHRRPRPFFSRCRIDFFDGVQLLEYERLHFFLTNLFGEWKTPFCSLWSSRSARLSSNR